MSNDGYLDGRGIEVGMYSARREKIDLDELNRTCASLVPIGPRLLPKMQLGRNHCYCRLAMTG